MSFIVRKLDATVVTLDDLGLTITGPASTLFDFLSESPEHLALSTDLTAAIGSTLEVMDPRDSSIALSTAEGVAVIARANDPHWGIQGGRFEAVDDPSVVPTDDFIIQYNSTSDAVEYIDPANLISDQGDAIGAVIAGMGTDGTDSTFVYDATSTIIIEGQDETLYDAATNNGTFVGGTGHVVGDDVTLSDGTVIDVTAEAAGVITAFDILTSGGTNVTPGVALTQTGSTGSGISFTLTPEQNNISNGTIQWDVNDSFLRNTGDTLDSGTLTIASGAAVAFTAGSTITIDAGVTTATIGTPGGGFTGITDLINKGYVDDLVNGLDWKESARVATTVSLGAPIAAQDETSYDGAGSNGTFVGGGSYVALDTITMSDGTVITVDVVSVGVITDFTVTTPGTNNTAGTVLTQSSTSGGGSGFTLTPGTANIAGVYDSAGGTGGTGEITGVDVTSIDGVSLVIGDRLVLKNQGDATQNGIYVVTTAGASGTIERASDHDTDADVTANNTVFVEEGTTQADTAWTISTDDPITLNTTAIDWAQVAGPGTLNAGIGLSSSGNTFDLDVDDLVTATAATTDTIAFHDADGGAEASGSQTRKSTFQSVYNEHDVPNAITSNGIIVRTANDTYASRTITVSGAGPLDGLAITNGDGVAGNPTVGLDIQNLSLRAAVDGVNDRVAVWDSTLNTNVYYTVNDIAGAASASNSFETWSGAGNTSGHASIVADSATDTVTVTGGIGINIGLTAASDTITYSFTRAGMADTAVVAADTVPFFDASNSNEPEFRSFGDILDDLNIPQISTINGQPIMTYTDTTRTETLSVESNTYSFGENKVSHLDWIIPAGNANDADSGHVMPLDGTIVFTTAHCEDTDGNSKDIHVFVEGVDQGSAGTLSGGANATFTNTTEDHDFSQGDRIRVQAMGSGTGDIKDTVVNVTVRWRA